MPQSEQINPNTLLVLGALGAGGLALYSIFGDKSGQGDPNDGEPYIDPTLPPPTLTTTAARILADRVYAAIYGSGTWDYIPVNEDEEEVIAAMIVPRNDNDVFLVIDQYGTREALWTNTGPLNLPGAIRAYLEPADVHRINMDYAGRGINVRF